MAGAAIQCVVVLYEIALSESKTISSLKRCGSQLTDLPERLSFLIYDNSANAQTVNPADFPFASVEYHHNGDNGGLVAAYNYGLERSLLNGIEWMLLLDQDTEVNASFLTALLREISSPHPAKIDAIVPKISQQGRTVSPQVMGTLNNWGIARDFCGICKEPITAINSGACLKVQALADVGGFPREYWLDYLDHIMFYRLQKAGGKVFVLNTWLEHRLSLLNLKSEMSVERFSNMLAAEWRFIRETGAGGGPLLHRLRLLQRSLNLLKSKSHAHALQAFRSSFS